MALIEDLIAAAGAADTPVREIVAGPDWIMVTAGGSGVAARPPAAPGDSAGRETPNLREPYRSRPLGDLLDLASSPDRLEASLGIAALNSALAGSQPKGKPRSFSIPRAGGKTVALIGEFAFIEDLKRIAARVITIDSGSDDIDAGSDDVEREISRDEQNPDGVLAGADIAEADIAIIRGSTLVDGTLESWLARTRHCYTVVYGPSTPLSPLLFAYGADQLVGIKVNIDDVTADWIREGRDNFLACPGVRPVVLGRDQQPRD
jgi:uncharacterized protein (DUF4213/DUF364 family)